MKLECERRVEDFGGSPEKVPEKVPEQALVRRPGTRGVSQLRRRRVRYGRVDAARIMKPTDFS